MKNFTQQLLLLFIILLPASLRAQVPNLNSYPTASATLFLDFDGHQVQSAGWNQGNAFYCQPAALTNNQIEEMFNRVSEDYRPFNINITTDSTKFLSAPLNKRMRIIITPTSSWYPANVGGVSYVGSFTWGDNTPGFVFNEKLANNSKYIAECITHESGHSVGLSHQSRYDASCHLLEQYHVGNGSGEISWAPVMGNSYYRNMTGWNDGPTPFGCANIQDNLTIITSSNGFGYRRDDYAEIRDDSTFYLGSNSFDNSGVITTNADKDAFKYIVTQDGNFHLQAKPYSIGASSGANLDVALDLYNGNTLIRTYNPPSSLSLSIDTTLNTGTYYFVVSGAGNENSNDYGSLGSYSITGFLGALAIKEVKLTGTSQKNKHSLSWTVVADEPTKEQVLEISFDGINFNTLSTINLLQKTFSYSINKNVPVFYRIKIKTVIDQTAYSNVVALQSLADIEKSFFVSTLVQNDVAVNASENYSYLLNDANGRLLMQGTGNKGIRKINIGRLPGGMYILRLANSNQSQTERIIKQ
ncbi:MAG: T9SS type A sorting domain-containing protein [Gloeobacteraceae cyanobacterium ES-bin-316]|nr:T9SS type A sorting domain-containing protein [Ferruginibacter sp.]